MEGLLLAKTLLELVLKVNQSTPTRNFPKLLALGKAEPVF